MRCRILIVALMAVVLSAAAASGQRRPHVIDGAAVLRPDGTWLEDARIVFADGTIRAVGKDIEIPEGAVVIDARGRYVSPGLIDMGNDVGLTEIGSVRGSVDSRELGSANPHLETLSALNPFSDHIPVARANGILYSLAGPGGGLLSGRAALIGLAGRRATEMAITPAAGVLVRFPRMPRPKGKDMTAEAVRKNADKATKRLREYLVAARRYQRARTAAKAEPGFLDFKVDLDFEAMVPVLEGELPLIVQADGATSMIAAVEWAKKEKVKIILRGCRDAWKIADFLADEDVDCILGSVFRVPRRGEPYDALYAGARVLAEAGIRFAFSTGGSSDARNLPYHAAMATSFGLDPAVARRALTRNGAEILGVQDRIGAIAPGTDASFFISSGELLDVRSRVEAVWYRGQDVGVESRHTRRANQRRHARETPGSGSSSAAFPRAWPRAGRDRDERDTRARRVRE